MRPTLARRSTNSQSSRCESAASSRPVAPCSRSRRPGYFSIELAKLGPYSIAGLDISHTFVELARKKAAKAGVHVDFRQGNASQMPFANDTFDFLLCRAAFKNFGSRFVPCRKCAACSKVDAMGLSTVNTILTKLAFRTMLLKNAYTREQFQHMLAQATFHSVDIQEVDIGFQIS